MPRARACPCGSCPTWPGPFMDHTSPARRRRGHLSQVGTRKAPFPGATGPQPQPAVPGPVPVAPSPEPASADARFRLLAACCAHRGQTLLSSDVPPKSGQPEALSKVAQPAPLGRFLPLSAKLNCPALTPALSRPRSQGPSESSGGLSSSSKNTAVLCCLRRLTHHLGGTHHPCVDERPRGNTLTDQPLPAPAAHRIQRKDKAPKAAARAQLPRAGFPPCRNPMSPLRYKRRA